jgi:hypothetical protein
LHRVSLTWGEPTDASPRNRVEAKGAAASASRLDGGKSQVTFDHGVLLINRTVEEIATASMAVSGFNFIIALVPAVFAKFPQVQSIVFHESGPFRDITGNDSTDEMLRIAFTREESDLIHWG